MATNFWLNLGVPLGAALVGATGGVTGGLWGARIISRSNARQGKAERLRRLYATILHWALTSQAYLQAHVSGTDDPPEAVAWNLAEIHLWRTEALHTVGRLALESESVPFGQVISELQLVDLACHALVRQGAQAGDLGLLAGVARHEAASMALRSMMLAELRSLEES